MIAWDKLNVSQGETRTISAIAKRAVAILPERLGSRMDLIMTLEAVHGGACRLNLSGLLAASDGDLLHDVVGMLRYLDRDTGELTGCFLPRYAKLD